MMANSNWTTDTDPDAFEEKAATDESWGKPGMDKLERDIRSLLAASDVPPEDQSSVLHMLASDVDQMAVAGEDQAE